MIDLFSVLYEHWLNYGGEPEAGWIQDSVSRAYIKQELKEKRRTDADDNWIKNTKGNISQKIRGSKLEDYINLNCDRRNGDYMLKIRKP